MRQSEVRELQRTRIIAAIATEAAENGVPAATVARVITRAGVSRKTFYDLFADRGKCLLAAIEQAVALAAERVDGAVNKQAPWASRMRAGLQAILEFFDEEPALARLCAVQSITAGPVILARRCELLDQLAELVDGGRAIAVREPPPLTAKGVVGGALSVVCSRLKAPGDGKLLELLNPLMSSIVLPYLGPRAARRERDRAHRVASARSRELASNPISGLPMRVTYRTVRVLEAIAEQPGLSNLGASEHAGITDQGQISKLLSRLARLELIHNTGGGQRKGSANAWSLTHRGEALMRAIRRERLSISGIHLVKPVALDSVDGLD